MVLCHSMNWKDIKEYIIISQIQGFEVDFLWKVGLKILNSGKFPPKFTHEYTTGFVSTLDKSTNQNNSVVVVPCNGCLIKASLA